MEAATQTRVRLTVGQVPIFSVGTSRTFFFSAGMTIDADGAPRAYHANGTHGLDAIGNAGKPGNWYGVVTDTGKRSGTRLFRAPPILRPDITSRQRRYMTIDTPGPIRGDMSIPPRSRTSVYPSTAAMRWERGLATSRTS